ncbi:MAG: putative colanic acid biosynthesis acetyltransferase WcaF [Phycisphaeraceae bacterium]|nr:MAG: putative colanic acid biosynthesis acetyltransferase WcaF [Phycisphaeraceae bacterium]
MTHVPDPPEHNAADADAEAMVMPAARPNVVSPHSTKQRIGRVLWNLTQATLFRWSPSPFHGWRVMLLKLFGADVASNARPYPGAKVWAPWNLTLGEYATLGDDVNVYCVGRISIGKRTTISQYTYLCGATHDFEHPNFPLTPFDITIGEHAWVAADVFVAPGVTIGDGTVVGARSSVFRDLGSWKVCAGSPAKEIRDRVMRDAASGAQA